MSVIMKRCLKFQTELLIVNVIVLDLHERKLNIRTVHWTREKVTEKLT